MKPDADSFLDEIPGVQTRAATARLISSCEAQAAELRSVQAELDLIRKAVRHDVRGHLMTISGYAELLRDHSSAQLDAKARQYLERIINCTDKILHALAEIPTAPHVATTPLSGTNGQRSETIPHNPQLP